LYAVGEVACRIAAQRWRAIRFWKRCLRARRRSASRKLPSNRFENSAWHPATRTIRTKWCGVPQLTKSRLMWITWHRAHEQAAGARSEAHRHLQEKSITTEFIVTADCSSAQHRHGGGMIVRALDAPESRGCITIWTSRTQSRMGAARHGFKKI